MLLLNNNGKSWIGNSSLTIRFDLELPLRSSGRHSEVFYIIKVGIHYMLL